MRAIALFCFLLLPSFGLADISKDFTIYPNGVAYDGQYPFDAPTGRESISFGPSSDARRGGMFSEKYYDKCPESDRFRCNFLKKKGPNIYRDEVLSSYTQSLNSYRSKAKAEIDALDADIIRLQAGRAPLSGEALERLGFLNDEIKQVQNHRVALQRNLTAERQSSEEKVIAVLEDWLYAAELDSADRSELDKHLFESLNRLAFFSDEEEPFFDLDDLSFSGSHDIDMPQFKTSLISQKGELLRSTYELSETVRLVAAGYGANYPEIYDRAAKKALEFADEAYASADDIQGDRYIEFTRKLLSQGLNYSPYGGEGRDWYQALSGQDIHGNKLSSVNYTYAVVGVAQSLAMKKAFADVGGAAVKNTPRLYVIRGGAGVSSSGLSTLAKMGAGGVNLMRLTNIVGVTISLVSSESLGPELVLEDMVLEAFAVNDIRITYPSPKISADPSEWLEYLTGAGRYDSQTGFIRLEDRDLAEVLLKEGYRNPGEIEGIVDSARNIGLTNAGDVTKNLDTVQRWKPTFARIWVDDASSINKELLEIGYVNQPYTSGTMVVTFNPTEPTDFVRVHGLNNQAGRWVMNREDIAGLSPTQIKEKFALPYTPTSVSDVTVPSGTSMRMGSVAPNYGSKGSGTQFEVLERVEFRNARPIGDL